MNSKSKALKDKALDISALISSIFLIVFVLPFIIDYLYYL